MVQCTFILENDNFEIIYIFLCISKTSFTTVSGSCCVNTPVKRQLPWANEPVVSKINTPDDYLEYLRKRWHFFLNRESSVSLPPAPAPSFPYSNLKVLLWHTENYRKKLILLKRHLPREKKSSKAVMNGWKEATTAHFRTIACTDTYIVAEAHTSNSPRTNVNAGSLPQQFFFIFFF